MCGISKVYIQCDYILQKMAITTALYQNGEEVNQNVIDLRYRMKCVAQTVSILVYLEIRYYISTCFVLWNFQYRVGRL